MKAVELDRDLCGRRVRAGAARNQTREHEVAASLGLRTCAGHSVQKRGSASQRSAGDRDCVLAAESPGGSAPAVRGITREQADKRGIAASVVQIATTYVLLGKPHEAEPRYQEELMLRRELGDAQGLSRTLMELAALYSD